MHRCNAITEDLTENVYLHEGLTAAVRAEEIPIIFLTPELLAQEFILKLGNHLPKTHCQELFQP